jgi:diaminopimelate decarboxylase
MGQGVLTAGFPRIDGSLFCEGVALERIAAEVGTPTYVYSASQIRERFRALDAALESVPHRVHFTLKANSNRAVLRLLRELGAGVEVVSGGELSRAMQAGYPGEDVIFGGVGKTEAELREALQAGILMLSVESEGELDMVNRLAGSLHARARVSLRLNPDVAIDSGHDYIKTGESGHKFGLPYGDALRVARAAASLPHVTLVGVGMHLGSMIGRVEPYQEGTTRLATLCRELRGAGISTLQYIDIGGGFGIRYGDEQPLDLDAFAAAVLPVVRDTGLTLVVEPGRWVVADSAALLTRVLYRKRSGAKEFMITDAGMTDLMRPSLYDAWHRIESVRPAANTLTADVVGPVCESGDFLALDRRIDDVPPGGFLAIFDVGAYGYAMASNYNSRRRGAEVLVDADRFAVVTARESYDDLVRLEVDRPEWRS